MQLAHARVSERPLFSERDRWFEPLSSTSESGANLIDVSTPVIAGQLLSSRGEKTAARGNPRHSIASLAPLPVTTLYVNLEAAGRIYQLSLGRQSIRWREGLASTRVRPALP
jgi:hypothetical protein